MDMAFLEWSNIYDGRINYIRRKTGKPISVKITVPIKNILDYFQNDYAHQKYIFPILGDFHQTINQKSNRIEKCRKQYNKELKKVSQLLDITIPLTSYVARHTYATTLQRHGKKLETISEALGHESLKVTKGYLEKFNTDAVDKADEVL